MGGVTAMVGLLRGVNVGGKAKLAMADLRRVTEQCGYERVRTYIQSGNVVFSSLTADTSEVAKTLQRAIAADGHVKADVMVRTRAELAAVINADPYRGRGVDTAYLHVVFLGTKASVAGVDLEAYAPEEATAIGRELHLYLPNGVGRSKLAADLSRGKGAGGTMRNWRTVTTLLAMAEEIP